MRSRTPSRQSRLALLCEHIIAASCMHELSTCRCMMQELSDKIAQLNAAIDEVSSQMKAKDPKPEVVEEVLA